MDRPYIQMFIGDWLGDTNLSMCSLGAQGLWFRMMCHMAQGEPYGYLRVNGQVISSANLNSISGKTTEETQPLINELIRWGVPGVDEHGCFYSRRMVKDENKRRKAAENGALGGNPNIKKTKKPALESPRELTGPLTGPLTLPLNSIPVPIPVPDSYEEEEERVRERAAENLRTMPDELRDNWGKAYQFLCVKDPSSTYYEVMQKFRDQAGVTDRLIVHLIEQAIKTKRRNYLAWVAEVLTECAANGITTPDEWTVFDADREVLADGRTTGSATTSPGKTQGTGLGRTGPAPTGTPHSIPGRGGKGSSSTASELDALSIK